MSIFGKMIRVHPNQHMPAEVKIILEGVLINAGTKSYNRKIHEEMVDDLYQHLDVSMYFEILSHLPGKHLDAFVKINDRNRTRAELDEFVVRNMPNGTDIYRCY